MKISVVMCTCNGAKYVKEQLESILYQTKKVDEIIVSDDNSNDDTLSIVEPLLFSSGIDYTVIRNKPAKGVSKNFIDAMKKTTGDYVFTADQDDIWKNNKVELFLEKITLTKKLLYFSDGDLVDANAEPLGESLWSSLNVNYALLNSGNMENILLNRCFVTGSAMAVSRQLINMVDYVPDAWLHDGWMSVVAVYHHSIEAVNASTYYYRQHENNVIGAKKTTFYGRLRSWLSHFKNLTKVRNDRFNRYLAVREYVGEGKMESLEGCVSFWRDLALISNENKIKSFKTITKHSVNGNYKKYYTGFRGALRDMISVLFLKDKEGKEIN